MKYKKKLFKHGGSLAMVIPSKFAEQLTTDNVTIEVTLDKDNNPSLIVTPTDILDTLEADPKFALFIESLYQDALENPKKLRTSQEVWGTDIHELIEGVDINEEE